MARRKLVEGRDTGELMGGPRDGELVTSTGYPLPTTIFVGKRPMGDGYASCSREHSERFPARYAHGEGRFRFRGYG